MVWLPFKTAPISTHGELLAWQHLGLSDEMTEPAVDKIPMPTHTITACSMHMGIGSVVKHSSVSEHSGSIVDTGVCNVPLHFLQHMNISGHFIWSCQPVVYRWSMYKQVVFWSVMHIMYDFFH